MDDLSLELLKLLSSRSLLTLSNLAAIANSDILVMVDPVKWLLDKGYIRVRPGYSSLCKDIDGMLTLDAPLEITQDGRIILSLERKKQRQIKFVEIRAWSTLGIAIIALIVSIVALVLGT